MRRVCSNTPNADGVGGLQVARFVLTRRQLMGSAEFICQSGPGWGREVGGGLGGGHGWGRGVGGCQAENWAPLSGREESYPTWGNASTTPVQDPVYHCALLLRPYGSGLPSGSNVHPLSAPSPLPPLARARGCLGPAAVWLPGLLRSFQTNF